MEIILIIILCIVFGLSVRIYSNQEKTIKELNENYLIYEILTLLHSPKSITNLIRIHTLIALLKIRSNNPYIVLYIEKLYENYRKG